MRSHVCASLLAVLGAAGSARASDVEISAETIGQGYQLVGASGDLITRRRLDQYLGFNVFNIGPKDAMGAPLPRNQWFLSTSMRLQFDFSDGAGAYPPPGNNLGGRDTSQEIANNRFELLYAYLGARDLGGFLDLRIGRQIDYDSFSFIAWDGIDLVAKTPFYLAAELYGGLLVNGFLPIDSPIFRPDGTSRGALSVHDLDAKPLVAVGLRSYGFRDLDARISFRQIFSPGTGTCNPDVNDPGYNSIANLERCTRVKDGTTEQSVSFSARTRLVGGAIVPWLGLRYDLLNAALDTLHAGARFTLGGNHALTIEYLYSYPTFDGDSIFNVFAHTRFDDIRLGYDVRAGRFRFYARGFVRLFNDIAESLDRAGASGAPTPPADNLDGGANVGARYDLGAGWLRLDGYAEYGYGGHKLGGDLSGRFRLYREVAALEGRLTLVDFADDLRAQNHALSFGVQLGARLQLTRGLLIHVIVEDNINRFYDSQLRFYALLDVAALFGSHGPAMARPRGIGPGMGQFGSAYGLGMGY